MGLHSGARSKKRWDVEILYRLSRLNSATEKDVYPLPGIDNALGCLERSRYFSVIDLQSGYWQVEVDEADRPKTAFITANGLFQFNVMPFGLTNAPGTFKRMMDVRLAGLKWNSYLVYLDDILVSKTFDEHLIRLEKVLQCISKANFKLKLSKCYFCEFSLPILGFVVCGQGISADPAKLRAVSPSQHQLLSRKCKKASLAYVLIIDSLSRTLQLWPVY